ncbi:hypothetical protein KCP70_10815 [Salmonella enterica subsp. enterica]|nr:hypothetical protein KCP70_10815 [Salmonella enterica subsp. enterica]
MRDSHAPRRWNVMAKPITLAWVRRRSFPSWMTAAEAVAARVRYGWFDNLYAAGETRRQYYYGERRRQGAQLDAVSPRNITQIGVPSRLAICGK